MRAVEVHVEIKADLQLFVFFTPSNVIKNVKLRQQKSLKCCRNISYVKTICTVKKRPSLCEKRK